MNIQFIGDQKVHISVSSYLEKANKESKIDTQHEAAMPTTEPLFTLDCELPTLSKEGSNHFCSVVSKLLNIVLLGCPVILVAVVFLIPESSSPPQKTNTSLRKYWNASKELLFLLKNWCWQH